MEPEELNLVYQRLVVINLKLARYSIKHFLVIFLYWPYFIYRAINFYRSWFNEIFFFCNVYYTFMFYFILIFLIISLDQAQKNWIMLPYKNRFFLFFFYIHMIIPFYKKFIMKFLILIFFLGCQIGYVLLLFLFLH